jgi:PKD repeat protein
MNPQNNNIRYWTDISNMYVTLRNYYCYPADHITVLMSDGLNNGNDRLKAYTAGGTPQYDNSPTDFGLGDSFSDVKGAATKADVVDNLTILNKTLTSQDTLFIFTTNHGGNDTTPGSGNAKLYLWNNESIKDSEFVAPLKYSQAKTIMMGMGQCFAGGFSGDFIDMPGPSTRVFTSAANKDEPSWGSAFNTPWIQGLNGNADSAPTLDGVVSMYEAYNWAKLKDEYATPNNIEHPQFAYSTQVNPDFINLSSCWLTTNCPAVVSLPTGQNPKRKSTSRCLYEDLNGDGHFNIDDATFFFSNFEWIAANEPITAVDFNGNNRIDFGDVVKLYLMSQNPNNVY